MEFNGSERQNRWAAEIFAAAYLTPEQVDNLLRYAGPTLHDQGIMDATIIIENRANLSAYADGLRKFYELTDDEKQGIGAEACSRLRQ